MLGLGLWLRLGLGCDNTGLVSGLWEREKRVGEGEVRSGGGNYVPLVLRF